MNPELEAGKYYWFRHKKEMVWRVFYIDQIFGEGELYVWYHRSHPMSVNEYDAMWEWQEVKPPEEIEAQIEKVEKENA